MFLRLERARGQKWGLISCSNLPVGGPVHMNQHLMANAQRKIFKKIRQAWLAHCAYPSLTANLPNPTCFPDVFLLPYKALLWAPQLLETHSKGIKTIPKTRKNSRVIPEISEKVRLAIERQQLARNIKKMTKFFDFS